MATLILSTAGSSLGGLLGGGLGGAIGYTLGALGGQFIDQSLFGNSRKPNLDNPNDIQIQTSTYGAAMPRVYGTARIAGQVIWATPFEKQDGEGQGKGGGGGDGNNDTHYRISLAVALAEGEIESVSRIWFDGQLVDKDKFAMRLYKGGLDQLPDPLIAAKDPNPPAYRGCAYVVFENLDLSSYGNRLPQMAFEVTRTTSKTFDRVEAVTLIPGATEWGYHPDIVLPHTAVEGIPYLNRNSNVHRSDVRVSIEQLRETFPNCRSISLVVGWFAETIDAKTLRILPKSVLVGPRSLPKDFLVGGHAGASGNRLVSRVNGEPAFGSTPSDESVYELIRYLNKEGFKVMFHPFIFIDAPGFPWRGRIGLPPNPTAADIRKVVNRLFPSAVNRHQFSHDLNRKTVNWATPPGFYGNNIAWNFKRFIYHYAHLCNMAGGVDKFILSSELKGLISLTASRGSYPVVDAMIDVAQNVKQILPRAKISYGANWDEYRGHQLDSKNFFFHLDSFWSDPSVDFVGINYYMPLSDWRDGQNHLDLQKGKSIYDTNYLRNNIKGGEGYDWYYASQADREQQRRSPLSSASDDWMWRWKDIASWWKNKHYNVVNGARQTNSTPWKPGMKVINLTEAGCPAVDKGSNQPNSFPDLSPLRSKEANLPYFSNGVRDEYMQSTFIEALLSSFDSSDVNHLADFNPLIGSRRMLDKRDIYLWCWDARPYPWFPNNNYLWKDGVNWATGHWLNGRTSYSSVDATAQQIFSEVGFTNYDVKEISLGMKGMSLLNLTTPRDVLEALQRFFFFDIAERNGTLEFIPRSSPSVATIKAEDCVFGRNGEPPYERIRAQEETLPRSVKLHYIDEANHYRQAIAEARQFGTHSTLIAQARLSIVATPAQAQKVAQRWLHETWIGRERLTLRVPPRYLALDVGDVFAFTDSVGLAEKWRITSISDEATRLIEAVRVDPELYYGVNSFETLVPQAAPPQAAPQAAPPQVALRRGNFLRLEEETRFGKLIEPPFVAPMDLPHLRGNEILGFHLAAYSTNRPNSLSVFRSLSGQHSWQLAATLTEEALMGTLRAHPKPRLEGVWDRASRFEVVVAKGELFSRSLDDVLSGANYAAIEHEGGWEIIQFAEAELVESSDSKNVYALSMLLRGLAGTENEMRSGFAEGARFVLLEANKIPQVEIAPAELNRAYHYRIGPSSKNYNDTSFAMEHFTYRGINLRPFSVVHLRGARAANGDIEITWVRRSRALSQDGWGETDIPLGESSEAYEIEIYDGEENLVRTIQSLEERAVYSAADQETDFTQTLPELIIVRVYQQSASFGRGAARQEAILCPTQKT